jgi:hypothetical protein
LFTNVFISHIDSYNVCLDIEVFHTLEHVQTHMHLKTEQNLVFTLSLRNVKFHH